MVVVPIRYVPKKLSQKDRKNQIQMLKKSRKLYKLGKYYNRVTKLKSYPHVASKHTDVARQMYNIEHIVPNEELSKATGCSLNALQTIVRKGEGAYYSSGSRPNQTPQSWGYARLASAITGGKAAAVDYSILKKGCSLKSKALYLAKKSLKKYNNGKRSVKKIKI